MDANQLPSEYQDQIAAFERRQKLAQMMFQNAMGFQGAPKMGPVASRTSPLAWLANAGAAGLSASQEDKAAKGAREVRSNFSRDQNEAIRNYLALPEAERETAGLTSRFPGVRSIAQTLMDRKEKRLNAAAPILGKVDPNAMLGAYSSGVLPGSVGPMPEPEVKTVGTGINGVPIQMVVNTGDYGKKTGAIGAGGTVINMPGVKQATAAEQALGAKLPEVLDAARTGARQSLEVINSANRITELLKNPATITGFAAGPLEGLASLGAALGFQGPESAAQTQALMAELAKQTLAKVPELTGAITEKERPFLELAAAGKLDFTPQALQRLADIARVTAANDFISAQERYNSAIQTRGAEQAPALYPFPSGRFNFEVDPKKYKELGFGKFQYIGDNYTPPPAQTQKLPEGFDRLTPAQQQRYKQLKGIK